MLPIPGTSSVAHLEENVAAAAIERHEAEFEHAFLESARRAARLCPGGRLRCPMSLRQLLSYAHEDAAVTALSDAARTEPQRAFVSASMRPYLARGAGGQRSGAAGADRGRRRPRRARPRRRPQGLPRPAPGALLPGPRRALRVPPRAAAASGGPARGGARRAARRRGRRGGGQRGGAGREGAGPGAPPARLLDRQGRAARPRRGGRPARGLRLRARGPGGRPRPVRHPRRHPRRLPGHRGARGALRAVRHRGRAPDLLLHLHPALAGGGRAGSRSPRRRSWRPSTASWPRSPPTETDEAERPDIAEILPVDRFCSLLSLVPERALVAVAAEEELAPVAGRPLAGGDHELPRRRRPPSLRLARGARARAGGPHRAEPVEHLRRPAARLPRPGRRQRGAQSLKEAEPELEKLVRSGYRTVVAWARHGEAERARYNLARLRAEFLDGGPAPVRARRAVRRREPARGLPRAAAQARHPPRAPPAAPPPRRAARGPAHRRGRDRLVHGPAQRRRGGARGPRHRALHRLRDEDRRRRDARLPGARVPRRRPRVRAERPAPQDQPLRGRRRRQPAALEARRQAVGADEAARPPRGPGAGGRADQPLRRAQAPRRARVPAGRRVADRLRARLPLHGDARPARRDRGREGGHGGGPPDGPPDLRRRGLRQDRGGAARRLQGGGRRQAGAVPGAHHGARPAALRHLHRAPARLPLPDRDGLALPLGRRR